MTRPRVALAGVLAFLGLGAIVPAGAAQLDVLQYGAVCDDPTKDSTPHFQAALDAAASLGGGTVSVPNCRFWFEGNLVIKNNVALAGEGTGPYDVFFNPGDFTQGPTLLPKKSTASGPAFIHVNGTNSAVKDLLFFYPEQAPPSAVEPDVYPPTILVSQPSKITGCLLANSYVGVHILVGRVFVEKMHIGAYKNDIIVDSAFDVVRISQVTMSIFWDYLLPPPQQIDHWVLQNGTAITAYKVDSLAIHEVQVVFRNIGIAFLDSPTVYGGVAYGRGSDIDLDTVRYGVVARSLQVVVGFVFTNLFVGPALPWADAVNVIWLQAGGVPPHAPRVLVNGGSIRGVWRQTLRVDAGTLHVRDVLGLNPIGRLPALGLTAPVLPASGVPYVSKQPAEARVMISGGSVSDVRIGGKSTGLTSGMFLISPGESIAVVYTNPPTWAWFLN